MKENPLILTIINFNTKIFHELILESEGYPKNPAFLDIFDLKSLICYFRGRKNSTFSSFLPLLIWKDYFWREKKFYFRQNFCAKLWFLISFWLNNERFIGEIAKRIQFDSVRLRTNRFREILYNGHI
jgi:hypothetical protein